MTIDLERPWAKLVRDDDKVAVAALPLIDHCLDVGEVAEIVLRAYAGPLAAAAGRALTAQDIARLSALAALHDLGKANRGFQARIDWKRDRSPKDRIGHTTPVAALLIQSTLSKHPAAMAIDAIRSGWGAREHFAAVMAHHGTPLKVFSDDGTFGDWTEFTKHWMPSADGDPAAAVLPLIDAVRARWPLAWEAGDVLPPAPRFVAFFAGLVTLADWLGSDTRRFPVDRPHGADRMIMRAEAAAAAAGARGFLRLDTPDADFAQTFGNPPYPFQQAAAGDLGSVALIEAETGSGKTEAALWRWLALRQAEKVDGLFFALPTRSAAVQLQVRVDAMLKEVWGPDAPRAVLAVPGYLRAGDVDGQALPDYAVRWDDGAQGEERWAAERANRFLAARVAVGTIDQALLGALPVKHALFRSSVLARSLLVVDEVHASDAYMTGLLDRLLDQHVAAGGQALLLSATLGAAARAKLLHQPCPSPDEAQAVPYPALSGRGVEPRAAAGATGPDKRVAVEIAPILEDAQAIATRAVAAARAGAAVLVVRNSVAGVVAVAQAVADLAPDLAFAVNGVATVHHGRFAAQDRKLLDDAVTAAFGKKRSGGGRVLVGTQTLEQSLDIDADLLLTDLAPVDVLLQRIGRLHRHGGRERGVFAEPRAIVLRPAERDLTPLLYGRALHGLGGVQRIAPYPDMLPVEATLALLEGKPHIVIPRDNRMLVERALHPALLDALGDTLGGDWQNHRRQRNGGALVDAETAASIALDLGRRFTALRPFEGGEAVATRLGARDLLVDLPEALDGAFGGTIDRIAIPAWMAEGADSATVERIDGQQFALGAKRFRYDRWGLVRA
ncbi:CRISPR-associated helicase Cas3' [uncultured Sphingomonas sp.]|uniref:CRISPR-associated helicase Cas3' n=1 Tax=uncultured Sphingomonas sp. TaxID=158754 RepID=UPI00258A701B|nr:CRISPR-associated helicase Cas3' [uncultured Sphingomonas sp.]